MKGTYLEIGENKGQLGVGPWSLSSGIQRHKGLGESDPLPGGTDPSGLARGHLGAWIPWSCPDEELCPSDPCAFSSPRLCKVPESKQHSRSGWNQSGAVSTGIAVQLTLFSEKAPAVPSLPPAHQPPTWPLSPLATPLASLPSGHRDTHKQAHHCPPSPLPSWGLGSKGRKTRVRLEESCVLLMLSREEGLLPGLLPLPSPSVSCEP